MRIYREHRIPHVWLVDPINRTLEVFGLEQNGAWGSSGVHVADDRVRIEPFGEVEIDLGNLWIE
jgi:Uma2 family endonuclease